MRIAGTHYNLNHKALEIFLSGCKAPHCKGCHNPELWNFNLGCTWDSDYLLKFFSKKLSNSMVENIWIMGGEPLNQSIDYLGAFLKCLNFFAKEIPIMLWTRYEEVPKELHESLTYVKIGEYKSELPEYIEPMFGIKLASENQKIIKL